MPRTRRVIVLEPLTGSDCHHRALMWPKPGISQGFGQALLLPGAFSPLAAAAVFTKNYALPCFDPAGSEAAHDPDRCRYERACEPDARVAAAVGRRLYIWSVPAGRKPAADRPRHVVAGPRPPAGSGPHRRARKPCVFL